MTCLYLLAALPLRVVFVLMMAARRKRQGTKAETFFFLIPLYLPLCCHVEEEEEDQKERITNILFRLMEVFVKHNLLFFSSYVTTLEHSSISLLFQSWKTGHFALEVTALWKSSSWHFCDQLKWRGGGKSCLHPFSHFPCFSFLIFCFHSIIIITSCQKYYWPQQSESQRGDTW